ncbi:AraC family transcriptional regulator [Bacteroides sp. ET336]|jgi:AraC-like DNA-binding protein|uniref:helix-turn-helix domain-containing protein n=1 Tax=Bacteroides sp. ET336 TaxID=2972459 RepID=UPI0021AC867D|nr:helix-turn-helix domain-containing protein [Bacteroides sp. ET336]MCR8893782.1 helix-turn-helix domain-containing protein [Bacteroides sp. ET336]MDN0058279.1 helix-turn-helix domain-containing protein [Bacteroides caecigallinarum]MDN0073007.1 helix-turn-helix domain-containing protein [Bacteroides caecigallinarum]
MENNHEVINNENDVQVKMPYNLREKKIKSAPYRDLIRTELADELYDRIYELVVTQKKYKQPNFSASDLAKILKTNTRYLSAVVNSKFKMNFSCLLNEYRIRDAKRMLSDKRYAGKNIEEISAMSGFANRQSFYAAFYRIVGITPNEYRKNHENA